MNYKKFSLLLGFSVWLVATLVFTFWGDTILIIDNAIIVTALYLCTLPVLYLLMDWAFKKNRLTGDNILTSSILLAVPGMICDTLCIKFHYIVFPLLTIQQAIVLSSWVIWAYMAVLLIGLYLKTMAPAHHQQTGTSPTH